jgi:predicted RNase H-like HicB family nuclease
VKYAVVFEKSSTGWSAYPLDLPGVGVAGRTFDETRKLIAEAITFHIKGLREDGDPVPEPLTRVEEIEAA